MNKIRLIVLLTGLILIIVGLFRIILAAYQEQEILIYTPAVLMLIGGLLIMAVRRK